jgi:uncharacterized protein
MIAALLLSVSAQAVPPPIEQFTANCRAPVYATDQLVCGDRDLRVLDAAIAVATYTLGRAPVAGIAPWLEPQADWFKRRSRCAFEAAHRECATDAYDERMLVLSALSPAGRPSMPAYRCGAVLATPVPAGALRLERKGKPVGAAVRQSPRSGWQPYIRLEGDEAEPSIVPSGGKPIRCVRVKD